MNRITSLRISASKIKKIVSPLLFLFAILMLASGFKSSQIEYKGYYLEPELLNGLEAVIYGPATAEEAGYTLRSSANFGGTMTVPSGSVIIDMGVTPQTIENGLKPYGLVVSMLNSFQVPVIWSINPAKNKDGIDFTVDGRNFKGGTFIISAENITNTVQNEINIWKNRGVVTYTTISNVEVPLHRELTYSVRWVINEKNNGIPIEYMENAGILSSAYSVGTPLNLNSCSDLFLIPHADPDWPGFGNPLLDWNSSQANGGNSGWIWAGCQAVSNLERDVDPNDSSIRTNFLARDPSVYPGPFDGYGLIEHGDHDDASGILPYPNAFPTDPIMQYMGRTDEAHDGGSEQIYLPYPTGGWRSTTKVGVWDPNQEDVLNGDSPGKAALIAYGRAFGQTDRGMVLYEGGHKLDNGTEAENVAAQRVFFNFALESPAEKAPVLTNTTAVPTTLRVGETIQFDLNVGSNTTFNYQWSTTCPSGSFNSTTIRNPIFTAGSASPGCIVKVKVTDSCGRTSFLTFPLIIVDNPDIALIKTGVFNDNNGNGYAEVGETISYQFTVTNTGNLPLYDITVVDPLVTVSGSLSSLAPGASNSTAFTATYTITQQNINNREVINQAFAEGCYQSMAPNPAGNCSGQVNYLDLKYLGNVSNALIRVVEHDGQVVFEGVVQPGGRFEFYGQDPPQQTFGSKIDIFINGTFVQEIHTSCSQPIGPGSVFGNFKVIKGTSRNNGPLQPVSGPNPGCVASATDLSDNNSNFEDDPTVVPLPTSPPLVLTLGSKTDVLCFGGNNGSITVSATGGVPPYLYSLNGGATQSSGTFNNLTAGVYTVAVTDNAGHSANLSVTLTQPDRINVQITKRNATTSGACNNGQATATPTQGVSPYTFQWSASAGNQTTATATSLPSGTHTVTVTDANGCSVNQGVVIDCDNDCDAVIALDYITHVSCKGNATGEAKVTASSQANPGALFTFTWNTVPPQVHSGVTSSTASNLPSGVYTVSVTIDGTVCSPVELNVTINEPSNALSVSASSTDESGPNTGDGTATANPSGGTPPYTYSWSPGGQTTRVITGLSAGQYTVTVTDSKGCTATATTTVNPGSCQGLSANATSTPVSCNGNSNGTATVAVTNGVGPFTYSWSPGGATTRTITNLSAGTYTVTVTDQTTMCTVNASTTVTQPNVLSSGIAVTSVSCYGGNNGSLDLTVTGGNPPYTFAWSNGATTEDLFGLTAGTYSVTITDSKGCTSTNSATVVQPNAALALTYTVQDVLCNGKSTGAIDITVTGGTMPYRYNWSNGAITQDLSSIPAGVYSVTVTDANGCTLTQTSITVSEPSNPISVIITKENATTGQGCNDGEATASPSGGVGPYTFLWSASAGNQTTATATNLPAGTHSVTIKDANGCELEQGVVIICDNTCDAIITVDQVSNVLCTGDNSGSATVSASSAANPAALFTFTWDTTPPQVYSGVTTSTINNLSSGVYTVSVTIDGTICQPVEQSVTITEPASVLSVSATSTDESGPNTNDGTATANPIGGTPPYTYSWSPGGQTTRVITGLSAGIYTVTVTDANGCTAMATTTVNPGTCRGLAASASSTSVSCNGNSDGTANVSVTGGSGSFTYLWSPGGQTTTSISGLTAGNYSVVVTDTVTLCTVNASTTVNEPNVLTSGIAITHVRCFGDSSGSLDLTVSGGTAPYTFLWSNGATTEDLFNLAAGTYSVTITDINGCTATKSATVLEPATGLTLAITSQTNIVCNDLGSVTVEASGGTIPYLYRVDGGAYQSSGTFNNLSAGNHTVDVLDANNCTAQVAVNILSNCLLAIDDINDTFINLAVSGDVGTNDQNPDGPAGTEVFTLVTGPTNGSVVFNADGTYTYTPALDYVGADSFEYQVCDGGNPVACDTAMVYIEVTNTTSGNDAPVANADTNLTEVDTPISGNVLVNDYDPDGDPITVTSNTNPTNGSVVMNPDGSYTYTPNAGFEGEDTFEYTICDNGVPALCDTAIVTIQVIPNAGNVTVANDDSYFGLPDMDITGNVLDNDSDPEGDNQTVDAISPISGPSNGTLVINADGTFTYTPNAGYTGTDQFVYGILDDGAPVASDVATVYIVIDPNNGANEILAIDDINDTFINLAVSGDVGTNDQNPDGPAGTEVFTLVTGPTNGSVVFNADGTYTYTPALDYVGADSFEYQVCDGGNPVACDTAMVYIEVTNTTSGNDAPVANADTNLTEVDTPISGNVLVNDYDPDGDPITVTSNTNPTNGSVVMNPDGSYTYTPNAGFEGEDTFEYTICDNGVPALCDTAIVTIQVIPNAGNVTVANDDSYFGLPDMDITGNVLDNDSDPEGDNQTVDAISPISGPSNGTLVINADGTFTYTPNAGYTGTDQFVYGILDDGAPVASDVATVYIVIDPNNGANEILAIDDINDTFINLAVSGDVGTNDQNPDGPAGTEVFTLVTGPTNGSVVFNADGTYTYTPALDYVGADSFEYQVCDGGNPVACDTAMVYIEVTNTTSGNDAPVANADTNLTEVDTPISGNVLVNDYDPDGDPITVTSNTNPTNGSVVMNPDGSYTYTPNAGFEGEDTFEYTICDNGVPALCDTAIVTIQVIPNAGNVTVANDDSYFGLPDMDITGNVLDNDSDPEGDNQTVDAISPISGPSNGTLVINADGTFTYTPNAGYTGTDQFVYGILDDGAPVASDVATVYIVIDPNNGANEILAIDDINDTFINLAVSGDVGTNDQNPDGPAGTEVFTLVTGPTNGSVVFNADGTYTYTPALDYVGADSFEYQVCDGGNPVACDTAMVYIEVTNTTSGNDAPVANADTNLTEVDTPISGNVLVNDYDPDGDPITVTSNTNPTNGSVVMNPDGSYTYTPNAGFEGEDTFEYTICDNGVPALCDTAIVTIQVIPNAGNVTVANDDSYFGLPDMDITGNVLDNDSDPEGDNQTVDAISPISGPSNGTLVINADGTFTYTPNAGYTGTDQFVYGILDDGAPVASDVATVYIVIDPNNGANEILAIDDINDTFINLAVSGDVGTNDQNPDGPAGTEVFTLVTGPTNGSVVFNADGTYTYTPALDYVGADSFEYQVCDGGNPVACDTAMVYIEVTNTTSGNDAPVANADTNLTEVDTPISGNVLVNDYDPDGDPITVTSNTNPTNGSVVMNPDGSYTYTPNAGFEGEDTFEYTICDNGVPALCDTAIVTIQVIPNAGNVTVANDDSYFGLPDMDITGNVLDNDSDPEGDNQTVDAISPISGPSNGTLVINADGTFTYTPNAGYTGTDQFVYGILDDGAPVASDVATVYIVIDPNNGANEILAIDDINDTFINLAVSGDVGTNDQNPDGPAGTEVFTLVTGPTNGSVVFNADGTYTYTPALDYVGADSFEYQVCDGGNPVACDTAMVYIEVTNTTSGNDAPVANADTNLTEVDTPISGNVLVNDYDPDGDPITVTSNTNPTNGSVVMNPDGSYTYTPNAGFEGEDTFEYTICDNGVPALCDTAIVTIQVIPNAGNVTVANDDSYFGLPDMDITGNVLDNDSDPEGDNQTVDAISPISGPSNGTLVINADGTFTYTPNAGYTGTDQFVYGILDDGAPVASDVATVYIVIDPNNGANEILAIDDINDTFINLAVSGDVGTNDQNPDGPAGTEVFTLVTGPTNGSVVFNADGTYTYTPALDYVGADSFEYQVCDGGNPVACDTAMVYIEVTNTTSGNDAPVANADTNLTEVDTPISGNVLVNDYDPDGDPITVTSNTNPTNGSVVMNPDGSYTYTPNAGFEGEDTFEYTICDNGVPALCDTAIVTIQVIPNAGNVTVANDDSYFGLPDMDITGNVLDNDSDPEGDNQTVDAISPISGPSNGTLVINADGTFTYTPNAGYTGTDQFVYGILDDGAPVASDVATVYIVIDPNNGANEILAIDDINDTFINLAVSGDVGTNDQNPDGPAGTEVFTLVTGPTNGSVVFNADGTYTYTPALDYVGADSFEYQVCDGGNPVACDTAMVYIEVTNTTSGNDAPVANADTNLTEVDTPISGNVLVNDYDPDGDPITVTSNTNPTNGSVVMNPDGSYTYTPNAGFEGEDTFEYTICDNGVPALCDTAIVTIQVIPNAGNVTVANDDSYFGLPDMDITGNVLDNDSDPEGDNQTVDAISPISGPSNGTLVINADGTFTYTPNAGYTGTDQFVYGILDDGAPVASDVATVYIVIDPNNGANEILAIDDINDTFINLAVSGDVGTNDQNPDGPAGTEVFTLVTGPTNGSVVFNADGTYTYTPALDYVGADSFEYQVCDGGNPVACDTAMVTIEIVDVTNGNDPPVANNDTNVTLVDVPVSGNALVNDFDPDGDPIIVTNNTSPTNGSVVVNPDGSYTYTPNAGFIGVDTFEYTICDNGTPALCDTAIVTIYIIDSNINVTIANDDAYNGEVNTVISGNVLDNDNDPEGDNQTVDVAISPISGPTNGTLVINANGTFDYTPGPDFTGTDQFVYGIFDDGNPVATDRATVYLLIQKTPAPAIAIVKTAEVNDQNQDGCTDVGETISYTFTVTNEGNVPLSSILVTDPLLEDPNPVVPIILVSGDDGDGILQETEIWLFTAEYAITQLDIELGEVINQATVIGTAPDLTTVQDLSGTQNDNDEPTATDLCQIGGMSLQLTAEVFQLRNINLGCSDGDAIRFTYILKNVGNGIISDLNIIHDDIDLTEPAGYVSGDTNGDNKLDIEEEWTYESLYLITQEDIEAGILITQASATGIVFGIEILELSDEDQTIEDNDPTIIEFCQYKTVSLEKTGIFNDENGNGSSEVGETISYTFSVINTGNVTLNNVVITDPLPGVVITGDPILTLLPEDVNNTTFTAVYSITQEDIDNGEVVNQAKVTGTTASGIEVTDDSDDPTDLTNFDNNGDGEPDDPTVVVLPLVEAVTFEIFNGITPNGDGFNDFFLIEGISNYPVNNVKIFNRWGVLVFETDGYGGSNDSENTFKGISEGRVTIEQNKELPTGTYFYILTFPEDNPGQESYNGYLYINR